MKYLNLVFTFSELAYFKLILTVKDARNYGIFEKRSVLGTAENSIERRRSVKSKK
uniref:Candidate secreted effector n=1 Tax=Meloidogyne incognita TaxID=6306 RepID=A0A914NQ15_MELIC